MKFQIDYTKLFEEEEKKFCTDHLKNDPWKGLANGIPSLDFTEALTRQNGKGVIYLHYVCGECGYPSEFYVRFCWYCEREFYGIPGVPKKPNDQCFDCQQKDWSF